MAADAEGNPMALFFWAFVAGLAGTALMDVGEVLAERLGITSRGS